ncbi:hypothetical protein MTR67_001793, partial [Solanum verrucosum]
MKSCVVSALQHFVNFASARIVLDISSRFIDSVGELLLWILFSNSSSLLFIAKRLSTPPPISSASSTASCSPFSPLLYVAALIAS